MISASMSMPMYQNVLSCLSQPTLRSTVDRKNFYRGVNSQDFILVLPFAALETLIPIIPFFIRMFYRPERMYLLRADILIGGGDKLLP